MKKFIKPLGILLLLLAVAVPIISVIRQLSELPSFARELVEHLRVDAPKPQRGSSTQ